MVSGRKRLDWFGDAGQPMLYWAEINEDSFEDSVIAKLDLLRVMRENLTLRELSVVLLCAEGYALSATERKTLTIARRKLKSAAKGADLPL